MSRIFAVLIEASSDAAGLVLRHPEHNQRQRAWFMRMANEGKLLACGSLASSDGAGLWLIRASSREEADAIVKTSPRYEDGMLSAEKSRVVEWAVSIGKERFAAGSE